MTIALVILGSLVAQYNDVSFLFYLMVWTLALMILFSIFVSDWQLILEAR